MYYILSFIFSFNFLLILLAMAIILFIAIILNPKKATSCDDTSDLITLIHNVNHPYTSKLMITGGQARLILWCYINDMPFPKGYKPRDIDYIKVDKDNTSGRRGILRNEGSDGIDFLVVSSISDYFYKIDLINNQVVVEDNKIILSKECLEAFIANKIIINPWKLRKGKNRRYLLLRACIQAGYDCISHRYYHRYGACSLSEEQMKEARAIDLDYWYYPTYLKKLEQIKNGNH